MNELDLRDPRLNWEAWEVWVTWRSKEKRKKVTDTAAKLQQAKLVQYDHETQIRIIQHSIENDYQGLFPEKVARKTRPEKQGTRHRTLEQDLNDRSWAE